MSSSTSGPIKGRGSNTVRGLTASTREGLFRIVGAAGISTGDRRDVGDQGPLRRHPHRRRQGQGEGARPGGEDHAGRHRRALVSGQGQVVQEQAAVMRWIVAAVLVALVVAAPAAAQETPGPTLLTFDKGISNADATITPSECTAAIVPGRRARRWPVRAPALQSHAVAVRRARSAPSSSSSACPRAPRSAFEGCAGSACDVAADGQRDRRVGAGRPGLDRRSSPSAPT